MRAIIPLLSLTLLLATRAGAATITLTAPTAPVTLADGDDYATTVLGDPWDFDKRREFLFEERFASVDVTGGVWTGVYRDPGASVVAPVFQGFTGSLTAMHLDMPEFGANRPVDADKYTELSYRMNLRDRKSTRLNSSHIQKSRMPSSA